MSRTRRAFKRRDPVRDSSLVVIATEGSETEPRYFRTLSGPEHYRNSRIRVRVVPTEHNRSSPEHVLERVRKSADDLDITDGDQVFVVLDLDRWGDATLSKIARECTQSGYELVVSTPCFELWLLLHLSDPSDWSDEYLKLVRKNDRSSRNLRFIGAEILSYSPEFGKKNVTDPRFYERQSVERAITRASSLDVDPAQRWCSDLGTRVYRVVQVILAAHDTF